MDVLILSSAQDAHAQFVASALHKIGVNVQYLPNPHFAGDTRYSINVDECSRTIQISDCNFRHNDFDLIWLRRLPFAEIPEYIHKDDVNFARAENTEFNRQFLCSIEDSENWLHKYNVILNSENKIAQLLEAKRVGMDIPATLISNDLAKIELFIRAMDERGSKTIFKSFDTNIWVEEDGTNKIGLTSTISVDDICDESVISAVPGIFQQKIQKAFEVRVNIFGDDATAIKINSNTNPDAMDDWRASSTLYEMLEQFSLPSIVETNCKRLMKRFDIHTGCFDFIVDDRGGFFFVDLNPQGQFLWIEEALPEVRLLKSFVSFIVRKCRGNGDIAHRLSDTDLSLATVERSECFQRLQRELMPGRLLDVSTLADAPADRRTCSSVDP